MKVTVVALNTAEARKAKEGLVKLKKGVSEFRRDLRDNRVDQDTLESFVKGLRVIADYFGGFMKDEPEVTNQGVPELGTETDEAYVDAYKKWENITVTGVARQQEG